VNRTKRTRRNERTASAVRVIVGSGAYYYVNVVYVLGPAGGHGGFGNPLPASHTVREWRRAEEDTVRRPTRAYEQLLRSPV
jgi:hypothetical protein